MTETADAAPGAAGGADDISPGGIPPGVDATRPSAARLYDYLLGGTNNLPVDREAGDRMKALIPDLTDSMWANRGFHGRAAAWIAGRGIRQFIDVGSGLPTQNNTHESVHRVAPGARVVYADNDPMVAAHGNELLADDGTTTVISADVRDPDRLLSDPRLRALIDFGQPVGLLMTGLMHFVADEEDPWGLVARCMAAVTPGSYLALSHGTYDNMLASRIQAGNDAYARTNEPLHLRTRAEVGRFFEGLELMPPYSGAEPAVTYVGLWGAEDLEAADTDGSRGVYCGVARKPGTAPPGAPGGAAGGRSR